MTVATAADTLAGLARVAATVAARAADLDEGRTDVRADLAALGAAGLLELGLRGPLSDMVRVIDEISGHSLAVGFSAWAHRMAIQYLSEAPPPVRDEHLAGLYSGERVGVTAMAAGIKQLAGLGDVPLIGEYDGDQLVVNGPVHWASNVFESALIVLPVRCAAHTAVVVVEADAHGVTVNPAPTLMALGATASTSLRLNDVRIAAHRVISTDLGGFVARIRPAFLLLQTAFCAGVTRAALGGARQAHTGPTARFAGELTALDARADTLRSQLYARAASPCAASAADLIRLRLQAVGIAVEATRLEISLAGGAAYRLGSAANRRFREAAFLPIQSPSEGQLLWELSRYE